MKNKFLFTSILFTSCFVNSGKDKAGNSLSSKEPETDIDDEYSDPLVDNEGEQVEVKEDSKEEFSHEVCCDSSKEVLLKKLNEKEELLLNKKCQLISMKKKILLLNEQNEILKESSWKVEKEKDVSYIKMEKEKDNNFNIMLREKDARILELTNQNVYLKQHQSSGLDKNVTICLKASCVIVAGCFAWQFFLRDFLFYHFPKLDKGKIERMKREEARLAALRARA